MAEKKTHPKPKPAHVIRSGNVVGNVKVHQTNTGFQYLGVELVREFRSMSTGKEQTGSSFFPSDEADLVKVLREAMAFIVRPEEKLAA